MSAVSDRSLVFRANIERINRADVVFAYIDRAEASKADAECCLEKLDGVYVTGVAIMPPVTPEMEERLAEIERRAADKRGCA
jgi:hypothetical protein